MQDAFHRIARNPLHLTILLSLLLIFRIMITMEPLLNIAVQVDPHNYTEAALTILKAIRPKWNSEDIILEVIKHGVFIMEKRVRIKFIIIL